MFDPHGDLWGLTRPDAASVLLDAAILSHPDSTAEFWSPDQPRDWHGRWTSGAGGGFAPAARNAERERSRGYVRDFLAGRSTLPGGAERELLAQHLAKLTVKELHTIKAEHGLKASGKDKQALVAKLAERFREHREKSATTPQKGLTTPLSGSILPVESKLPTGVQKMTTQTQELPKLTGSERQVAYAEDVRRQALAEVAGTDPQEAAARWEDVGVPAEHREAALRWLAGQTDARYWIDHARSGLPRMAQEALRAVAPPPAVRDAVAAGHDVRFVPVHMALPYVRVTPAGKREVFKEPALAGDRALRGEVGAWVPASPDLLRFFRTDESFRSLPRVEVSRA
jgi:hypothetical protein